MDSSDELKKNQLKKFQKLFTFLDPVKNICDLWEEVKIIKMIWTYGWLWGVQYFMEEDTTDVMEITGKWKLEVEPAGVTELLPVHDKTVMDKKLFLMNEQRKLCFWNGYTPGIETMRLLKWQ